MLLLILVLRVTQAFTRLPHAILLLTGYVYHAPATHIVLGHRPVSRVLRMDSAQTALALLPAAHALPTSTNRKSALAA